MVHDMASLVLNVVRTLTAKLRARRTEGSVPALPAPGAASTRRAEVRRAMSPSEADLKSWHKRPEQSSSLVALRLSSGDGIPPSPQSAMGGLTLRHRHWQNNAAVVVLAIVSLPCSAVGGAMASSSVVVSLSGALPAVAYGVNSAGEAVGSVGGSTQPAIWINGVRTDLQRNGSTFSPSEA